MKVEGLVEKEKNGNKKEHKDNREDNMNNNFLLISLEEKKAKKIAEAINNETSRKILDALAKKEYTETELSKDLGIPISTVHYSMKQLVDANLVIVDEFHYSSKGKEVNHYKLANKYIIIAPKGSDNRFMEALNKILPLTVITAVTGGVLTLFGLLRTGSSNMMIKSAAMDTADAAPRLMMASEETLTTAGAEMAPQAIEVTRPFMQSEPIAWFLIGALSIIIIYFLYEVIKKRK
jgi:DNA-binding transcriptional ArsR family regulator